MKEQNGRIADAPAHFVGFSEGIDDILDATAHGRVLDRDDTLPVCRRAMHPEPERGPERGNDVEDPVHGGRGSTPR